MLGIQQRRTQRRPDKKVQDLEKAGDMKNDGGL
jgi:hypothetical protein